MLRKIISGAQTGADQAGLAAAVALNLQTGGYIPKGRRTNIGPLTDWQMKRWDLIEHTSSAYPPRTEANVRSSDGTVLFGNMNSPGCKLTVKLCDKHNRPYLENPKTPNELFVWTVEHRIEVLNVAGNREETNPGIYASTKAFLINAFEGTLAA